MSAAPVAADAADVKPAPAVKPEDPIYINIVVKEQNGAKTHFKLKRNCGFKKVKKGENYLSAHSYQLSSAAHGNFLPTSKHGHQNCEVYV